MKIVLVALISFFAFELHSQSITLRVLGQSTYVEPAEASGVIVSFSSSDLSEEKKGFQETMSSEGIEGDLIIWEGNNPEQRIYRFEVDGNSPNLLKKLIAVCNNLNTEIIQNYYKLPPHDYANEDKRAVMALENANSQATIVARNLDYKVQRILNIDDETTYDDPLFDLIDLDSRKGEALKIVMEALSTLNSQFKMYSPNPDETKGYNIWVTYELTPN